VNGYSLPYGMCLPAEFERSFVEPNDTHAAKVCRAANVMRPYMEALS